VMMAMTTSSSIKVNADLRCNMASATPRRKKDAMRNDYDQKQGRWFRNFRGHPASSDCRTPTPIAQRRGTYRSAKIGTAAHGHRRRPAVVT
jgi:hypothetical protein